MRPPVRGSPRGDSQFTTDGGECLQRPVEVLVGVRRGDDRAQSRLVQRDCREDDRLGEDALVEQPAREAIAAMPGSPTMTGVIGVSETAGVEPEARQLGLEATRVRPQPLDAAPARPASPGAPRGTRRRRPADGRSRTGTAGPAGSGCRAGPGCRRRSRRGTPIAFDSVPTWIATRPWSPKWSTVPRPFRPSTPDAWASSTKTAAPNSSAASTIPGSGAMSPSIENTPSVTTRIRRYGRRSRRPTLRDRLPEQLAQRADVVVREDLARRLREAHAVDDRGVVERVGDDQVLLARDRRDDAGVRA